jgi:hypothetical protein
MSRRQVHPTRQTASASAPAANPRVMTAAPHLFEVDPPVRRRERDFRQRRQAPRKPLRDGNCPQRPKVDQRKSREMAAKAAFLLAGSNIQVSEVCLVGVPPARTWDPCKRKKSTLTTVFRRPSLTFLPRRVWNGSACPIRVWNGIFATGDRRLKQAPETPSSPRPRSMRSLESMTIASTAPVLDRV